MATAESLAKRVSQAGGAALIIDYGQDGPYEASLQAIRQHKFVGLLEEPGSADLSVRVDYSALRCTAPPVPAGQHCCSGGYLPAVHVACTAGLCIAPGQESRGAAAVPLPVGCPTLPAGWRLRASTAEWFLDSSQTYAAK